jgi:hypothetical protein
MLTISKQEVHFSTSNLSFKVKEGVITGEFNDFPFRVDKNYYTLNQSVHKNDDNLRSITTVTTKINCELCSLTIKSNHNAYKVFIHTELCNWKITANSMLFQYNFDESNIVNTFYNSEKNCIYVINEMAADINDYKKVINVDNSFSDMELDLSNPSFNKLGFYKLQINLA